jgi:hypothetical protein
LYHPTPEKLSREVEGFVSFDGQALDEAKEAVFV